MKEIEKLHKMLLDAGIEHEWIDRTPECYSELMAKHPDLFSEKEWGWQIVIYNRDGSRMISVIEGYGTYGVEQDLLEIMGLLTPEERKYDSVAGWLTADDVFGRIERALK